MIGVLGSGAGHNAPPPVNPLVQAGDEPMASIFKRARDRQRKGSSWYIAYTDENGVRRKVKGCPDKTATEAMARKLESEAELRRRGVIDPKASPTRPRGPAVLADHLADFHAYLIGKGSTRQHANLSRNRVARLIDLAGAAGFPTWPRPEIQAALKTVRDEGAVLRSVHHYMRAVKGFSRWLWRDGRAGKTRLAHLTSPNPDADRRHERRALAAERTGPADPGRRSAARWS